MAYKGDVNGGKRDGGEKGGSRTKSSVPVRNDDKSVRTSKDKSAGTGKGARHSGGKESFGKGAVATIDNRHDIDPMSRGKGHVGKKRATGKGHQVAKSNASEYTSSTHPGNYREGVTNRPDTMISYDANNYAGYDQNGITPYGMVWKDDSGWMHSDPTGAGYLPAYQHHSHRFNSMTEAGIWSTSEKGESRDGRYSKSNRQITIFEVFFFPIQYRIQ